MYNIAHTKLVRTHMYVHYIFITHFLLNRCMLTMLILWIKNGHYIINSSNSSSRSLILLIRKSSTPYAYSYTYNSLQTMYPSVHYSDLLSHYYHKSIISACLV